MGNYDPQYSPGTYGDAVTDRVKELATRFGSTLLGKGTARDATAETQEAYRRYAINAMSRGEQPLSLEQFQMQRLNQQNRLMDMMR